MIEVDCRTDEDWLAEARAGLRYDGCCVVTGVLDDNPLSETRDAMYPVQEQIVADVGMERLDRAGELGVLRPMLMYDPRFFRLLALDPVLSVVDATVSETAILHLQNGLILPPVKGGDAELFQRRFHQDFPRFYRPAEQRLYRSGQG